MVAPRIHRSQNSQSNEDRLSKRLKGTLIVIAALTCGAYLIAVPNPEDNDEMDGLRGPVVDHYHNDMVAVHHEPIHHEPVHHEPFDPIVFHREDPYKEIKKPNQNEKLMKDAFYENGRETEKKPEIIDEQVIFNKVDIAEDSINIVEQEEILKASNKLEPSILETESKMKSNLQQTFKNKLPQQQIQSIQQEAVQRLERKEINELESAAEVVAMIAEDEVEEVAQEDEMDGMDVNEVVKDIDAIEKKAEIDLKDEINQVADNIRNHLEIDAEDIEKQIVKEIGMEGNSTVFETETENQYEQIQTETFQNIESKEQEFTEETFEIKKEELEAEKQFKESEEKKEESKETEVSFGGKLSHQEESNKAQQQEIVEPIDAKKIAEGRILEDENRLATPEAEDSLADDAETSFTPEAEEPADDTERSSTPEAEDSPADDTETSSSIPEAPEAEDSPADDTETSSTPEAEDSPADDTAKLAIEKEEAELIANQKAATKLAVEKDEAGVAAEEVEHITAGKIAEEKRIEDAAKSAAEEAEAELIASEKAATKLAVEKDEAGIAAEETEHIAAGKISKEKRIEDENKLKESEEKKRGIKRN